MDIDHRVEVPEIGEILLEDNDDTSRAFGEDLHQASR